MSQCSLNPVGGRRRIFWTTQQNACPAHPGTCPDDLCSTPGLALSPVACEDQSCECCVAPNIDPACLAAQRDALRRTPRTFITSEWIKSLALNILLTDARLEDKACGYTPGTQGGHWSESFRTDKLKIGSLVRNLPYAKTIRDSIALVKARLMADMSKLVTMGLATSIAVDVTYLGGSQVQADITIVGQSGEQQRVGLSGTRLNNAWAWR